MPHLSPNRYRTRAAGRERSSSVGASRHARSVPAGGVEERTTAGPAGVTARGTARAERAVAGAGESVAAAADLARTWGQHVQDRQ
jgi:hypothetical protein